MYITQSTFGYGPATVKNALAHELGHYYGDVNWDYGIAGGKISNPSDFKINPKADLYGGDGTMAYNYAIRNAGNFHLSYSGLTHGTTYGGDAWKAYNASKWIRLIPWR